MKIPYTHFTPSERLNLLQTLRVLELIVDWNYVYENGDRYSVKCNIPGAEQDSAMAVFDFNDGKLSIHQIIF